MCLNIQTVRYLLFIFLTLSYFRSQSQTRLSDLDINRIKQKSIQKFVKDLENKGIVYFEDLHASVDSLTDPGKFDSNCHYFNVEHGLDKVWDAYLTAHPAKIWQGKVVSCGFIYSTASKCFIFPEDQFSGLEKGQLFFIEMRVFFGLVHFPVCFMVTGISKDQHSITFSYISESLSKGAQTIKLVGHDNEKTEIIHSSIHQTKNILRDKTLYPIYHKKAIKEVHANIARTLAVH
jgi:hypothetical protein